MGPKRLGLLLIEVFCAVAASHAYGALEGKDGLQFAISGWLRFETFSSSTSRSASLFSDTNSCGTNRTKVDFDKSRIRSRTLQLRSIACKQFFRSAQPMFLLAMEGVLHVFRFFCLTVSKAEAISYPSNRLRPHHRLFTTMALSSAEASTIRFRTVSSW